MAAVNCLHHENPPTWAWVEPATLGAEGQLQTNHATQRDFPCQNCGGGDRWCRHLSSLRGILPSYFVLSPVWCSRPRPTTGILLDPCRDEFRRLLSDYGRQVASATTQH
ncbi:uncharacterized protein TNCV_4536421 [Trichonephila clavipes]|nr:uncharacterized protein TNCV_4536421 [Trichonephila clavipes]